jgi:hypothetical protein
MKNKNLCQTFYIIVTILSLHLYSCSTPQNNVLNNHPAWVNEAITLAKKNSSTLSTTIARYLYHNQTVYYISPVVTDGFSQLFDKKHTLLCSPEGGLTGKGDGQCTDFFQNAKNKVILFKK